MLLIRMVMVLLVFRFKKEKNALYSVKVDVSVNILNQHDVNSEACVDYCISAQYICINVLIH